MEGAANAELAGTATLAEFQERLYRLIKDELEGRLGHWLGRWEYDCEVEYWGGKSYLDPTLPDELLLRSQYPFGVRLNRFWLPSPLVLRGRRAGDEGAGAGIPRLYFG